MILVVLVILAGLVFFYLPIHKDNGDLIWGAYCGNQSWNRTVGCFKVSWSMETLSDEWFPKCPMRYGIHVEESENFKLMNREKLNWFDGGSYYLVEGSCHISHPAG